MKNLLKSRDIAFPIKIHIIKAMDFPVVVYECESWTIKKAECQSIDAFKLWCWKRLLLLLLLLLLSHISHVQLCGTP